MLLFEVVDTGDGFDSEEEAAMFKPFSQVDTSVSFAEPTNSSAYKFINLYKVLLINNF